MKNSLETPFEKLQKMFRVKKDRKLFEIPALLSSERGNLEQKRVGKFKFII